MSFVNQQNKKDKNSDTAYIDKEEARAILERQLLSHQHIQKQAQAIVRLFIAVIPIIVSVFLTTNGGNFIQIPNESSQREAASGYVSGDLMVTSSGITTVSY